MLKVAKGQKINKLVSTCSSWVFQILKLQKPKCRPHLLNELKVLMYKQLKLAMCAVVGSDTGCKCWLMMMTMVVSLQSGCWRLRVGEPKQQYWRLHWRQSQLPPSLRRARPLLSRGFPFFCTALRSSPDLWISFCLYIFAQFVIDPRHNIFRFPVTFRGF